MVKLNEIAEVLDSLIVSGEEFGSKEFLYCRGSDLMSDVLAEFAEGSVFLTGLTTVQSIRTASVSGAGAVEGALGAGDVPLSTTILVDVENNGTKVAAINKIEWQAYVEKTQITTGTFEERIEVEGGGKKQISIPIAANIAELLSGEGKKDVMNFIQGLMGQGEEKSTIKLKLKPFFKVGKSYVPYPGFINVEHEVE